jgi:hypothetical protein
LNVDPDWSQTWNRGRARGIRAALMAKVLGIGGVFFKAEDGQAVRDWYARVLGFSVEDWGGVVFPATGPAFAGLEPFKPRTPTTSSRPRRPT